MHYNTARPKITLPPDVYDTYEFATLAFGGIGGGATMEGPDGRGRPVCQVGYACFLAGDSCFGGHGWDLHEHYAVRLSSHGVTVDLNDEIVRAVNRRKGRTNKYARIAWADYCAEGNIHRGEPGDA